jgi:hypothetical protein
VKAINEYASNEFHRWQRDNLPKTFIIQDVDAWLIVPSTSQPLCLLELKRSSAHPEAWSPFAADNPNYLALLRLAERARLDLRVIYFQKGVEFQDDTPIASWRAERDGEAITWSGPNIISPARLREWLGGMA